MSKKTPLDEIEVDELDLSVRTANCLRDAGIERVAQLRALSDQQLLDLKNFGRRSLREVRDVLEHLERSYGVLPDPERMDLDAFTHEGHGPPGRALAEKE